MTGGTSCVRASRRTHSQRGPVKMRMSKPAWRATAGAGLLAILTIPLSARAQRVTQVDLDNDSFNFWQGPKVRSDREYTQGTRITMMRPATGRLARLLGGPNQCATATEARDCRLVSYSLTQAMYTPTLDDRRRQPGERPYAGWLGIEAGLRRERRRGLTAFSVDVGVTGAPSLAEPAQIAVHRIFRFPHPDGWNQQLPTEVAMVATNRGVAELLHLELERSRFRVLLAPEWKLRLGTVATDATLGAQATIGLGAPPPWQGATNLYGDRWGVFMRGGARQTAVAHNLFLDGSTFRRSAHVEKLPVVAETMLGIGTRSPLGMIEWQVHSLGREYRSQPRAHAYSTLSFSLR